MIYLDNNATTFLDPKVLDIMRRLLEKNLGNPSSIHALGQESKNFLFQAIKAIALFFNVRENEIYFTSGATEALNMAILGFSKKGHILSSNLEHLSVLEPLQKLEKMGRKVTFLSPNNGLGTITFEQIEENITADTTLIVLGAANNETGVRTDIEAIAALAEKKGIAFLVDGVGILGKEAFSLPKGVSAFCFSGHKIHAPLGIGCALIRKEFPFDPLILGGPQQRGKRGGTENIIAISALSKALECLKESLPDSAHTMEHLRKRFEEGILARFPHAIIYGNKEKRVPNTSNICFPGIDGETLLMQLDRAGVCASIGAACSSGGLSPSRVLLNMGVSPQDARSSLRFSLSRFTTQNEIDRALEIISRHAF